MVKVGWSGEGGNLVSTVGTTASQALIKSIIVTRNVEKEDFIK